MNRTHNIFFVFFNILTVTTIILFLDSCVTMKNGANWLYADFSGYNYNYKDFDVSVIDIEMNIDDAITLLDMPYKTVEANEEYKVIRFDKWRAVPGPDYIEQSLFIKVSNDKVSAYKITNDAIITNPW